MIEADVLIAGVGPAGAALAIALSARGNWRVVMADRATPPNRLGETLPGAARALMRDLGVLERFETDGHPRMLGQASIWGSDQLDRRDAFVDPHGPGWRIDRGKFERSLVESALRQDCRLIRPASVTDLCRAGSGGAWRVRLEDASGSHDEVHCRFVVDATGRRASLARRLGVRQQRLDHLICSAIALPAPASPTDLDDFSIIEAAPGGWYYGAGLPSGKRLIAFHTDFDLAVPQLHRAAVFLDVAANTAILRRFGPAGEFSGAVSRFAAWSGRLASFAGPRWAAVGDAACSFDPVSSQGLFNALYGGLRLGQAIDSDLLHGGETGVARYAGEMESVWAAFRRNRGLYYASEPRWRSAPFWQRRIDPA